MHVTGTITYATLYI